MKASEDFLPQAELDRCTGLYLVWSRKGWGRGRWFVVRCADRKVMFDTPHVTLAIRRKNDLTRDAGVATLDVGD